MQKIVKKRRHRFAGGSPIAYSSAEFRNFFMGLFSRRQISKAMVFLTCFGLLFSLAAVTASAANIGTVVPVLGQVADLVYDRARNQLYLANPLRNEVEIYSVAERRLTGTILAGLQPGSLALSPDGDTLYIANVGSFTVS